MHRFTRSWVTTLIAWVAVLFIGGAAIAGVGSHSANKGTHQNAQVEASDSESPEPSESAESPESPEPKASEAADNHGQCVSTWADKAKEGEDGLEGRFFGGFVSAVAQTDDTGADCDESELLAEWQAKQEAAPAREHGPSDEHGKSGEEHGNSSEGSHSEGS